MQEHLSEKKLNSRSFFKLSSALVKDANYPREERTKLSFVLRKRKT